jgi:putative protease
LKKKYRNMDNENKISLQEISAPKNQPILINGEQVEVMAPAGSRESLAAALQAGADSIYFGIEALNMRAHSASRFTIDDLRDIAMICAERGVKSYLTVNTIIYDDDLELMRQICDAAHEAGISAVIAADVAVMDYCNRIGQEVHLSTQLNISNTEALRFYARFADVVVLARELNMFQVHHIRQFIDREQIKGPSGEPLRIEMFCHGALCMAVSGKCYLSLDNLGRSANRGECMQVCRRAYTVRDRDTGVELDIDNKYIMSPKDLKTIGFIDKMVGAGVRVFKIEGRARSAEYVYNVVRCYKEALQAVADGTFTPERVAEWDEKLSTVFNRGFWDGYYQGQKLGEWSEKYGSSATEKKVYVAKGVKYFSRLGVGEFYVEAGEINVGDRLLLVGPTTGVHYLTATEIHFADKGAIQTAKKGQVVSIPVPDKIRPSDKLYKLVKNEPAF